MLSWYKVINMNGIIYLARKIATVLKTTVYM